MAAQYDLARFAAWTPPASGSAGAGDASARLASAYEDKIEELETERQRLQRALGEAAAPLKRQLAEKDQALAERGRQLAELTARLQGLENERFSLQARIAKLERALAETTPTS